MTRHPLTFACLVLAVAAATSTVSAAPPPLGLTVPAQWQLNHDGDTITADITVRVNVRLCGDGKKRRCWAPELNEAGGPESRASLREFAAGKHGTLWIPMHDAHNLGDLFSLRRIVGDGWVDGTDESMSEYQVRTGNASTTRGGQLGQ